MTTPRDLLLPGPQTLQLVGDALLADRLHLAAHGLPRALVRAAVDYLTDRAAVMPEKTADHRASSLPVRLALQENLPLEGYELLVNGDGALISAADRHGFLYGAVTLRQWLAVHDWPQQTGSVPGVAIRDRPDFPRRGFLLDISRNKVPQMTTLLRLVDLLADLKYNELQLYTEHTFAYPGHERVWEKADPLTPSQIQQLDGYCRLRGIQLVPNQNSFGHFHRWLVHEPYRQLAECPEGIQHPFSEEVEPFSLCPTDPDALALLHDLYGKLLPNFTSGRFHVGFDETFEVGRGRSRGACESEGIAAVYSRFLEAVRKLAAEHGRRVLIWADMLLEHRKLLENIPDDIILCEWGYEAGHPFREDCAALGTTGCEIYVCPGTSSWASFAGRGHNMLANLAEAAAAGLATGASGYLLTDWGDRGHLQPLSVSYPALLAGAAFAWHGSDAKRLDQSRWAQAIDRWIFEAPGSGLGTAMQKLANAYAVTGATQKNGTALFHLIMSPNDGLGHPRYRGLSNQGLARVQEIVDDAAFEITRAETHSADGRQSRDELLWIADTLRLACAVGQARLELPFGDLPDLPQAARDEILTTLGDLAGRRLELWLRRSREGGWADSLQRFTKLERLLSQA